jgi:hypothetical protein
MCEHNYKFMEKDTELYSQGETRCWRECVLSICSRCGKAIKSYTDEIETLKDNLADNN